MRFNVLIGHQTGIRAAFAINMSVPRFDLREVQPREPA